jgi:hypothetical protein
MHPNALFGTDAPNGVGDFLSASTDDKDKDEHNGDNGNKNNAKVYRERAEYDKDKDKDDGNNTGTLATTTGTTTGKRPVNKIREKRKITRVETVARATPIIARYYASHTSTSSYHPQSEWALWL